jgi:hypothetical protein
MQSMTALAIAAALVSSAVASTDPVLIEKAAFARALEVPGARLVMEGAGLFRWKYLVKVYAAAHYVGEDSKGLGPDADIPRRLEIAYFVGISGKDFGLAAEELLGDALTPERLSPLRERLAQLHGAYVDVKSGDRYALTYVPNRGTELALNGRPLALIEGADFARAYFGIWIGRKPIDVGLRDALLPAKGKGETP